MNRLEWSIIVGVSVGITVAITPVIGATVMTLWPCDQLCQATNHLKASAEKAKYLLNCLKSVPTSEECERAIKKSIEENEAYEREHKN
jgi:hypothetical protein